MPRVKSIIEGALALLLATMPVEFASHPPAAALKTKAAKPDVRSGTAHRYRTVLRDEAAEGVNFNGHYRVATWGCGTNCIEWAVIDLATGRVWMAPEPVTSTWSPLQPDNATVDWMEFYTASALLYVHSSVGRRTDRTFDTRRVYVWKTGAPRLLRKEPLDY
jgi:hypothetical protein